MDTNKTQQNMERIFGKVTLKQLEIDVLQLMAGEYNNKAIAHKLKVSVRVVTGVRERLLKKTNTINGIGLTIWAIKNNVVKL